MAFWVATAVLTLLLVAIAVIDHKTLRIPDTLSLPLLACGFWAGPVIYATPWYDHAVGAVAGYGVFAAIGGWYFRRNGTEGLGLGDAKVFAAAGAWLGWQALPVVLLIAAAGGLVSAVAQGQHNARAGLAFGPWLALAIWVVWVMRAWV
jgi:leader peptidase (prepilin peptidase) / N-methyltransferase